MSVARIDPADFPVLEHTVWLNHAAISPWPRAVIEAVAGFVESNATRGPRDYAAWLQAESRLRRRLAELLGAAGPDDIALVQNTSDALNLVAAGLDWRPGDAVVFPAGEFPSNALPWRALARLGVEVREVPVDPQDPESALAEAVDERVRLLAVSSVRYDSGIRLDLERLGQAARAHGALFCVDAIQHLGALPLDVSRLPVDFVAAGSHKWLLAPEGLGVFWSRPEARARLAQVRQGWRMWPDPFHFDRASDDRAQSARRFEIGTLNTTGIHGLDASVGLLLDQGMDAIGQAVLANSKRLSGGLLDLAGVRLVSAASGPRASGIVSFRIDGIDSTRIESALRAAGIHAALRGDAVRLSPHFYTPAAQLDRAIEVVHDLAAD